WAPAAAMWLAIGAWSGLGVVPGALLLRLAWTDPPEDLDQLATALRRQRDAWAALAIWGLPMAGLGLVWVRAWAGSVGAY
ncbi:MAG: hypothetical protein ABMA64_06255, partial [Myxococcota bacterium]